MARHTFEDVCDLLASFLAPNERTPLPGLVLGPLEYDGARISTILMADHVTELVLHEAVAIGAQLVVSRISPLSGDGAAGGVRVRRLVSARADSAAHVAMMCAKHGIGVFAFGGGQDHADGGIEQWLCAVLGAGSEVPLIPHPPPHTESGRGRLLTLDPPLLLRTCVNSLRTRGAAPQVTIAPAIKFYLDAPSTEIEAAVKRALDSQPIKTIAVCFGDDADEVLRTCTSAQVFVASELSTESALAANDRGVTVVLIGDCVGREFFGFLVDRLQTVLNPIELVVSKASANPLRHVDIVRL
tara:strand:- start:614 stop:1510 length:897 start_codon:yes stop_codon:yes gene_type:complete